MMKNQIIITIIVIILIVAGVLAGLSSLVRPNVLPASAPETDFSAERALEHVSAISQVPHPPGSEEIDRVRTYIFSQLEEMGLSPEIQETRVANSRGTHIDASTIKNIVVKISGTNSSRAILLDAHYDTRAMTPGASDCGSCVATLLETARALLAGPPLQNDVIMIFTDNEEYGGGLGAIAFIEQHPWAQEIGLVLNFEGLGSTGPSILFETGPASGWAVGEWGKIASLPVGQSWFYEIYRLTPIGSDLNWYSDAGIAGLNFGYWAEGTAYHSLLDNPETIDPQSLQHHGSYALAMTNHFGNFDFSTVEDSSGDAVYFSLFPGILINYSASWVLVFSILVGLLLVAIAVVGIRSKQLSIRGALKGVGGFLLSLLASAGLATGIWMGAVQLHSEYQAMLTFRGMVYNAPFYLYAFIALSVAIAAAILVWFRRKTSVMDLSFGAMLVLWLFALVTSILMPGFSYLFTWPLFFSALAFGWILFQNARGKVGSQSEILLTIGALPGIIIFAPAIYVMFHFALAPMIGIMAFMVSLPLGLLIPQLDLMTREREWDLSRITLVICVVFLVIGSLTANFDEDQRGPNAVAYLLNADSGEATWFSGGPIQDDWTLQFFSTKPERDMVGELFPIPQRSRFPIMQGEAPPVVLAAPVLEVLSDQTTGDQRTLQLYLSSARQAPIIKLDVEPYAAVLAVIIDGKQIEPIESERDLWSLIYYAVPLDGFEITLELDASTSVNVQLSDQTWELVPDVMDQLGLNIQPRSVDMMPMPNFDYGTVVVKTFIFH